MPVQATWRDKTNIIGFFNEFSKTYSETDFLEELYRANYNPDTIQIFVLDEMNISRVEYYFADLLSVLEYPKEQWRLKVMQLPHEFIPPIKLEDGFIRIPENSYFVGTANKDDSTFTITDKVYDRALTIDFMDSNKAFDVDAETSTITLGHSKLKELYEAALSDGELALTEEDYARLESVFEYATEHFDIALGNRILNQINHVVPVFCACGGTKEAAIDFMLAKKLVFKVEGRFEEHIKDSLAGLIDLLYKTYGDGSMKRTVKTARAIMKNL
jgi:5-methylcytosine-specific restriction endonuclease McrBC GTP-binding regulatory subunit McrB